MKERRQILVEGVIQGVGFRPFVYRLATKNRLAGSVVNDGSGVVIELEGERAHLDDFLSDLREHPPPLASIDRIVHGIIPTIGETGFRIAESRCEDERRALVTPDVAVCDECVAELFDPNDRRYRYPFINCTNCGPRFTIVQNVPYDRKATTMSDFSMCAECRREFDDPADRRFHAQPNACARCGPSVSLLDCHGHIVHDSDPIRAVAALLSNGAVVAVKGLGGYHLACDAFDETAVRKLRKGKRREEKPFALMARDLGDVRSLCFLEPAEEALLRSGQRPIVLLKRRASAGVAPGVAPGQLHLGVMLPYTPLHHLMLQAADRILVMTSGNSSEEPIACEDADAVRRLSGIADYFLVHDRKIQAHCDDSVVRFAGRNELIIRRARGYAPRPIAVAEAFAAHVLACGAHLKNTFCLGKDDRAFVSQHIGDLSNFEAFTAFAVEIDRYQRLFDIEPRLVAHDLHPRYLSTQYALDLPGVTRVPVQHHHAHIASCMAEHGLEGPVIGVAFDGLGYGADGAMWGGEFLIATLRRYERCAHLRYVPLAGGDAAVRQPWRAALAYMTDALPDDPLSIGLPGWNGISKDKFSLVQSMMARGINTVPTSSCGRLFDAVASILGLRHEASYEGQAAVELETAAGDGVEGEYPFEIYESGCAEIDLRPAIRSIVGDVIDGLDTSVIAARFHNTVVSIVVTVCERLRRREGLRQVCLSGGTFQNVYLLEHTIPRLESRGYEVFRNIRVPPNDGGISFGQAAVANATIRERD